MDNLFDMLKQPPEAAAYIKGSRKYPNICGRVLFYTVGNAVLVRSEIMGLPEKSAKCQSPLFAFHIHGGNAYTGTAEDPFSNAGMHYNPDNCPHPYHAGDMPPLFGVNGNALSVFLTDRFTVNEIIGKTVIIHANPDDFKTQPSGNSGEKIACGVILKISMREKRQA